MCVSTTMESFLQHASITQKTHDVSIMSAEPPDKAFEALTLEVELSGIKGSPLDPCQDSVPSIATDDDSQHSFSLSVEENKLEGSARTVYSTYRCGITDQVFDSGPKPAKEVYKCDFCSKVFQKRSRLQSHVIVHSDEKDFLCVVCGKGFKNKSQLQRHRNTHSAAPNFCCNICGRGFKHNDVAKHIRRFHSGPRSTRRGGVANPNAPVNSQYNSHPNVVNSHQTAMPLHPQPLNQQNHLPAHHQTQQSVIIQNQSSHQGTTQQVQERLVPEEKNLCGSKLGLLPLHPSLDVGVSPLDSLSGSSNDSLQMCPTPFSFVQYSCMQCSMSFPSHQELLAHEKTHSKMKIDENRKQHQCHICLKIFTRASGLTGHLELHSRTERRREPNPDFCCPICRKMFTRRSGLNAHILQHGGVLRFWCDEPDCGRGFVHSYQLIRHKRTHSDILPYSCDVCGRSFRHNDLAKHMRTHTGDKPYNCQHCGKAFASSSSLRTHERMHLALKEHLCEICDMGFSTVAGLRRHARTHVEEIEELCSSCGKFFPSKNFLNLHVQASHHCTQLQTQSAQQLHEASLQHTPEMQVLPVPLVDQQVPVQQMPAISLQEVHIERQELQQPNPISMHELDPIPLQLQNNTPALATMGASVPGQGQQPPGDTLPVLVPFSLSVPISVPFGINLNSAPPDQVQLNQFLTWEQKF